MGNIVSGESVWRRTRRVLRQAAPAAGTDWVLTVPAGHVYRLLAAYASLVTSATAGQRLPRLQVTDGTVVFLDIPPVNGQQASLTHRYQWLEHANTYQAVSGAPATVLAAAASTAATGTLLSYTVPTGAQAVVGEATFHLIGGTAPTVQLQLVRGASTVVLWSGSADTQLQLNLALTAGDVLRWQCTAAGAGSTADFTISGEPSSLAGTTDGEAIAVPELYLEPGWALQVSTDNLDAGDAWGALELYVVDTTVVRGPMDLLGAAEVNVVVIAAPEA